MKKRCIVVPSVLAGLLLLSPAYSWDDIGHKVVARIAWDHSKPTTRTDVVTLLQSAPRDAGLRSLFPHDPSPLARRERLFFLRASTWPDIVRDPTVPARRTQYHHGAWHFINYFWRSGSNGAPVDLPHMTPQPENVVERLERLQTAVRDTSRTVEQRAVDLAWVLHLLGDIHQPLHCSARVTRTEPQGDQGGNLFRLGGADAESLHSYWDGVLRRTFPRQSGEAEDAYINRIAAVIVARHPQATMAGRLQRGQYAAWAQAGHETAKAEVYPPTLRRGRTPSAAYGRRVYRIAAAAIALAGYRLADLLDQMFDS